ncbi:hypothetical protein ACFBZI_08595 [Moraxella sp. ZJ142]|uniref:hypothetical protein n=1 Tax=Moraxella marmotae TaxID=3344520 RepID=UPI0035D43B63
MLKRNDLADFDDETLTIVNAYLAKHNLPDFGDDIPPAIKQAGVYLAKAWQAGELFQARDEGVIASKSASAGDVSIAKTYVQGTAAMGQHEQIALALLEPFVQKFGLNMPLIRY